MQVPIPQSRCTAQGRFRRLTRAPGAAVISVSAHGLGFLVSSSLGDLLPSLSTSATHLQGSLLHFIQHFRVQWTGILSRLFLAQPCQKTKSPHSLFMSFCLPISFDPELTICTVLLLVFKSMLSLYTA